MEHSTKLPHVPVAWDFMKSELWYVDQWILDAFNTRRESPYLFERALGVAMLTQLALPKPNVTNNALVICKFHKQSPPALGATWFERLCNSDSELQSNLEQEWETRAKTLVESFDAFEKFVAENQDPDILWQEGLKILHARDDLQRVAGILAEAMDCRDKMHNSCDNLDMHCAMYHSVWSLVPTQNDKRLSASILPNMSDFYGVDWWTIPVQQYHADKHQKLANSGLLKKALHLNFEATGHCWLGLFKPDKTLRDNFLMYLGESDSIDRSPYSALLALGEIKPEHLFHGGCQILADTEYGLANFASVTPFKIGDVFALVDPDEHRQLVGEFEHLTVMDVIVTYKEAAEARQVETDSQDNIVDLADWIPPQPLKITPPAMDMLLDFENAPAWLKQHVSDCIKSKSAYAIAQIVGFLARIGNEEIQKRGKVWAYSLTTDECEDLGRHVGRKLVQMLVEAETIRAMSAEFPNDTASAVAVLLADRDECESILWVIEAAGSDPKMDLSRIEQKLQDSSILFKTPLSGVKAWTTDLLKLVHERLPACWWAARANLG